MKKKSVVPGRKKHVKTRLRAKAASLPGSVQTHKSNCQMFDIIHEHDPSLTDEQINAFLSQASKEHKSNDSLEQPELSPVEKIISDRYGDVGLQVYSIIDGQKTAEEIMHQTGLTEQKLVEILDFMDEQGIIKLDYPYAKDKGKKKKNPFK